MIRTRRVISISGLMLLVAIATVTIRNTTAHDVYHVTAILPSAHGLVDGSPVVAAGVSVGSVQDIRVGTDGLPRIRLRITKDFRLRASATADLRLASNAGELNREIAVTRGAGPPLGDAGVIPLRRTAAPVELDDVLDVLDPRMRSDLRYVLRDLDSATDALAPQVRATLRHSADSLAEASSTLHSVSRDGTSLHRLVREGSRLATVMANSRHALGQSVASLSLLLDTTAVHARQVRDTVATLPNALRQSRLLLSDLATATPNLRRLVRALTPAARALKPAASAAAPTLEAAKPALSKLTTALRAAPPGLIAVRPMLRALSPVAFSARRALHAGLPALDALRAYAPDIMGFVTNWSDASSSYDAAGHGLRLLSSSASIPDRVVAPDSDQAGYLPLPFIRPPGTLVKQPWTGYRSSGLAASP